MTATARMRQIHRFFSAAFTLGVIANFVAMRRGEPPPWVGALALIPLIVLLVSGLYLLAQPYVARLRSARVGAPRHEQSVTTSFASSHDDARMKPLHD